MGVCMEIKVTDYYEEPEGQTVVMVDITNPAPSISPVAGLTAMQLTVEAGHFSDFLVSLLADKVLWKGRPRIHASLEGFTGQKSLPLSEPEDLGCITRLDVVTLRRYVKRCHESFEIATIRFSPNSKYQYKTTGPMEIRISF